MTIAIILLLFAVLLFVAAHKKWIHNNTLETLANITGIVSLLAAILVFIIPAAMPTEEEKSAYKIKGPFNGELNHDIDDPFDWYEAEVLLKNFTVEVDFVNPYSAETHLWNAVVFFRDGYRIWIHSDNVWGYGYYDSNSEWTEYIGELPNGLLNTSDNMLNHMKLIVKDDSGCFFVNGELVGSLDFIDTIEQVGDIAVGISQKEAMIDGEVTKFENFEIYTGSEIEC